MQSFLTDPKLIVSDGKGFQLSGYPTDYTGQIASQEEAEKRLRKATKAMAKEQQKLYATDNHSILLVFQAMDAAGKDSTIRHVFSGVNPTGFQVSSFKAPSKLELDHDYLWRTSKALPERGRIGIFNRSHYEEVLICKVHPAYVLGQRIPGIDEPSDVNEAFWEKRYQQIANWEEHLSQNGTVILKFFLNVSLDEQKRRFLSRIDNPKKNWKFNYGDMKERAHWPAYMEAYQTAIARTAKPHAPWYIIPADNKPNMRAMVAEVVLAKMKELGLSYPAVGDKEVEEMVQARQELDRQ